MKRPIVEIHWLDAHGGEVNPGGWGRLTKKDHHKPRPIRTVGLLYHRDKVGITVALSMDGDNADCYMFIPAGCITGEVRELG